MIMAYNNPVEIIETENLSAELSRICKSIDNAKIVVVCSKRFAQTEKFSEIKKTLPEILLFCNIEENPTLQSCQEAIDAICPAKPNIVIAIGGGSVLDTAKAVRCALYNETKNISDLIASSHAVCERPLFIMIPTTHGTGSEVTMWATIWDKEYKKKFSISEEINYPDYAIYDVTLLMSLPLNYSIISVLDALSHAFEALWNKNENPTSDEYAMQAIHLVYKNLDSLKEPVSEEARKGFLTASRLAGLSFSNTRTAAAHSISYPLTLFYQIPHGIACSMPLRPLLNINKSAIDQKLENLLNALGLSDIDVFWQKIIDSIDGKISYRLRDFGVKKEDLKGLIQHAFTKGRMDNNIVDLTENDVYYNT